MSHHWREWKFTRLLGKGYRKSSIGSHRVLFMVEAERDPTPYTERWIVTKPGRTVCGQPIPTPDSLSPSAMPRTDPFECWTVGWRPCSRCFPEFDIKTWNRLRALEDKWYAKGNEQQLSRLDHLLWRIVYARRMKAHAA